MDEKCCLSRLQKRLYQVWKNKRRETTVVLSILFNSFHTENRHLIQTTTGVSEVAVWQRNTKGDAGRRPDISKKNIAVLEYLADATES